jgi:AAHS family benzoate transporter-like MFS transporter
MSKSVVDVASSAKFNPFHRMVLFWCIVIVVLDGYDLAVVGAAMPAIMSDLSISATQAGWMASSALVGMMIGAVWLGVMADKYGRPRILALCVCFFSLFTALSGLTTDVMTFAAFRFIAGLGIGGAMPIAAAQIAEFAPGHLRTRLVALTLTGYSVGGILVALVGKWLIESYGWQSVFYAAALPILFVPVFLKMMPDSIAYLQRKGDTVALAQLIRKLDPSLGDAEVERLSTQRQAGPDAQQEGATSSTKDLFVRDMGFSTVMICLTFFMGLFAVYALSTWLTKLLAMAGYSLGSALNFVLTYNLGAIAGALGGGWLADKFGIKKVLVGFYAAGAATLGFMGYSTSQDMLFVAVFLCGASTLGSIQLSYAFASVFYPSAIRSTGIGFASAVGRLGAIAAPVMIGWIVSLSLPMKANFASIAMATLVSSLAVASIRKKIATESAPLASSNTQDPIRP